jgi:hypothetical protein
MTKTEAQRLEERLRKVCIDEEHTCKDRVSINVEKAEFPIGKENYVVYKIRVQIT